MANVSSFSGAMPVIPGGTVELARVDGGYVTTSTTSESTGMNMGCSASIVCDGGPILVEAWSNYVNAGSGGVLFANVYVDGATTSNTNRVWRKATTDFGSIYGQLVITPAAGTRTIAVRPWHSAAAGYVDWATMRVSKIVNQNDGLKPFWTPPVVTQLPSQATVGDQVIYAADASNGVYWQLQYDGLGTYPWKFIGGSAYRSVVNLGNADETTTSTSYTNLSTVGPDYQIVLPGDYEFSFDIEAFRNDGGAGTDAYISYQAGSTNNAADNTRISNGSGQLSPGAMHRAVTGLSAGDYIQMKYRVSSSTGRFRGTRRLFVTPIRVKAA